MSKNIKKDGRGEANDTPHESVEGGFRYDKMKTADLKKICREKKLTNYTKLNKHDLIKFLSDKILDSKIIPVLNPAVPSESSNEVVFSPPPLGLNNIMIEGDRLSGSESDRFIGAESDRFIGSEGDPGSVMIKTQMCNATGKFSTNNKLEKETNTAIASKKPLVLNDITIDVDPVSLMINATQMCKAANKLFADYQRLSGTKDYLQALESKIGIQIQDLVKTEHGGNHYGTWVHRLLVVHLAQWLSPSFAVQVSLWVKSLEDDIDLLINENKILNSTNNKLEKENKKIKQTALLINEIKENKPNIRLSKQLILNGVSIEVDPATFMVNATQMCRAAGKDYYDYNRLGSSKTYLQALKSKPGIPGFGFIKSKPGHNGCTMVHRLIAYDLARWCSAEVAVQFALWIDELLLTGSVELGNEMSTNQLDNEWKKKIEDLTGAVGEEKEKYIVEANRCKDLELRINLIEEDKIKKEENEKKKIIDDLNTTISVFSTETKSNLNFHEEKEVIYLGYIGNFLFKYGQSSNFEDRLGTHEKSTSYEKFEIVKVFSCKNPVVSERRVREWVRKKNLEYKYKPEGEAARGQREIIKIESKEMLERVCKAMHKYSNFNINKMSGEEVEIKRIEADKEVDIKRIEAEIKRIEAEVDIKKIDLLAGGKITFEQYIELKNLK